MSVGFQGEIGVSAPTQFVHSYAVAGGTMPQAVSSNSAVPMGMLGFPQR